MAVSKITAVFTADIRELWSIVTSLENYQWRSDLSKIEVLNEKQFIEYTKEGFPTTFTITATEIYKRWEFEMENSNMDIGLVLLAKQMDTLKLFLQKM